MRFAIRAGSLVTLAREAPARGMEALEAPLRQIRDGVVTVNGSIIEAVEPYAEFRKRRREREIPLLDMGDACLAPGFINSHCHLELSNIAGQSVRGQGFVPWLRSIVSLVATPPTPEQLQNGLDNAVKQLTGAHTAHVGDVGSRAPVEVGLALSQSAIPPETFFSTPFSPQEPSGGIRPGTAASLPTPAITATHFLEVLGFMKPGQPQISPLPPELAANGYAPAVAATLPRSRYKDCAIAGHALYSTSPEALGAAHAWCLDNKKTFSLHLAEFPEETELLLHGRGALYDYIHGVLLPGDWQPPRERPVVYAHALGLLGPQTLAIHCTQCTSEDVAVLASTGTSCCLCPRSNEYIGTGEAPAREMADAGILLCLGTDGLSSNDDLDITKEMNVAGKRWGFSRRAQLRMVTVNAAHALGISARLGSLEPGKSAFFSVFSEV